MKNYFSHDYNATLDPKIIALLGDYGAVGYGIYWRIIEMLHSENEHKLPLKEYIIRAIAKQMSTSVEQTSAFINDCINVYELFIEEDGNFYSKRVLENIEKMEEIKEKRSKAGKISAENRKNSTCVQQNLTSVQQNLTSVQQNSTQSNKIKEKKRKEIKENNNKEEIKKEETEIQKSLDDEIGILEQKNYSDLAEYTKNNDRWIEAICITQKLKKETVLNELKHFPITQKALGREVTNLKNFKEHFNNYLAKKSNELRTAENNKANSGNTELEKIMKYKADYMASVNGGKK
jgi:uncharacterized protein YdaU (DUF1376 family)